ncbi:MAG: glycerol dehydrogenase [Christensenellaceae bacterium]|jgi:glycerol dehydrogenase
MTKIIASPSRYIQGKGALQELRMHAEKFGKHFFVLISESGKKRVSHILDACTGGTDCSVHYEMFGGESSKKEIERVVARMQEVGADVVIGIGGGKIHDTAKAAAFYGKKPVVIVPTIASTDAPCSALSVIYSEEGVFEEYLFLPANPDVVLVDTDIILHAPTRLLVAGMGDALATFFEARACVRSGATNCVGGTATVAAATLAELCYKTLLEDGYNAALSVENKAYTKALENIVEANTYLSGIGFESAGLAGAHAFHNALTVVVETHAMYHGEKVAFGTLVQLALENAKEELEEAMYFCASVGLPITFEELGMVAVREEKLREVATLACATTDTMGNLPFPVAPEDVYGAMVFVDALGREMLGHDHEHECGCGCGHDHA